MVGHRRGQTPTGGCSVTTRLMAPRTRRDKVSLITAKPSGRFFVNESLPTFRMCRECRASWLLLCMSRCAVVGCEHCIVLVVLPSMHHLSLTPLPQALHEYMQALESTGSRQPRLTPDPESDSDSGSALL